MVISAAKKKIAAKVANAILNRGRKVHGKIETSIIKQRSGKRTWHRASSELAQDIFNTFDLTVGQMRARRSAAFLEGGLASGMGILRWTKMASPMQSSMANMQMASAMDMA